MTYLEAYDRATACGPGTRRRRLRDGSLLIEAVIAIMLLATASLAVMRLAATSVTLQRDAEQKLAATLTAQNILARLDRMSPESFDDLDGLSKSLEQIEVSYEETFPGDVVISARRFENQGIAGVHLHVLVTIGPNVRVSLDDWRLTKAENGEARAAKQDAAKQDDVTSKGDRGTSAVTEGFESDLAIVASEPAVDRSTRS